MKFTKVQRIKYMKMFEQFMKEYGKNYSKTSRKYIKENFLKLTDPGTTPDILLQLYCDFGIIPDEQNIYIRFTKMIGDIYGWDNKILEIGGGYYPMFSKYIDQAQQKDGCGTITVIDPLLVTNKLGNVKLKKEEFNREMDVSDFDLLVGICPCEAIKEIISSAIVNKKEFFIAMCGCTHFDYPAVPYYCGYDFAYKVWTEEVFDLAKEQEADSFVVNKQFVNNFPYPIINSKRKK